MSDRSSNPEATKPYAKDAGHAILFTNHLMNSSMRLPRKPSGEDKSVMCTNYLDEEHLGITVCNTVSVHRTMARPTGRFPEEGSFYFNSE